MSLDNDNSKRVFKELEANFKVPLVLSERVLSEINYLHSSIGPTEWSGILVFSETKGSIDDLENLELRAEGIYPMDIGSSSYTEFDYDASIIDVYDHFDILSGDSMTKRIGTIHTHHTMDTFFSGTDKGELHTNADKHLYYLSLIVNFSGKYKAKIAILVDHEPVLNYKNKNLYAGKPAKALYLIDCDIFLESTKVLIDRVTALKEESKRKAKLQKVEINKNPKQITPSSKQFPLNKVDDFSEFPLYAPKSKISHWEVQKILGALLAQDESHDKGFYTALVDITRDLKVQNKDVRKQEIEEIKFFAENYFDTVVEEVLGSAFTYDVLPDALEKCLDNLKEPRSNDTYGLTKVLYNGLQSYRFT